MSRMRCRRPPRLHWRFRALILSFAIASLLPSASASPTDMRTNASLLLAGRLLLLEQELGSGLRAWGWDEQAGRYERLEIVASEAAPARLTIHASTVLARNSAIVLLETDAGSLAVWRAKLDGDRLRLARITAYARPARIPDLHSVAMPAAGTFVATGTGSAISWGGAGVCTWSYFEDRYRTEAFMAAVQRNEVLVADGALTRFLLNGDGCAVTRERLPKSWRAVQVTPFAGGWLVRMNGGLNTAIVHLDRDLRPRALFSVRPEGWRLESVGPSTVVLWSVGSRRAYALTPDRVTELELDAAKGTVDPADTASGEIRFASTEGVVTPRVKRVHAWKYPLRMPGTGTIVSILGASLRVFFLALLLLVIRGLAVVVRAAGTDRGV